MARNFTGQPRSEALLELISNQLFLHSLEVEAQMSGLTEELKQRMRKGVGSDRNATECIRFRSDLNTLCRD